MEILYLVALAVEFSKELSPFDCDGSIVNEELAVSNRHPVGHIFHIYVSEEADTSVLILPFLCRSSGVHCSSEGDKVGRRAYSLDFQGFPFKNDIGYLGGAGC